MPKYLDLSASVSVSMQELLGAKKEQNKAVPKKHISEGQKSEG